MFSNFYVRKLAEFITLILSILNRVIPKSKNKVLIFNSSPSYQNNFAIYNYMVENNYNDKYNIYYYMPEIKNIKHKYNNVVYNDSFIGAVFHFLTSKTVFFDTGNMRIRPSKKQDVINLWHGVPFKSIGFLSNNIPKDLPRSLGRTFSKILVSSKSMEQTYIDSFLLEKNQILFNGQPRNDLLINTNNSLQEIGIDKNQYKKIIMWMTTYRVSKDKRLKHTDDSNWSATGLPLLIDENKLSGLNSVLEENNMLLLIKMHTTGIEPDVKVINYSNIQIIEEKEYINKQRQLYQILGECDALVTDYSSVFIDYLHLNKPIGFIVDDIIQYTKLNGFNFKKPLDYMPGFHINNLNELILFINQLASDIDSYEKERLRILEIFNEYHSTNNCKNLLDRLKIKVD